MLFSAPYPCRCRPRYGYQPGTFYLAGSESCTNCGGHFGHPVVSRPGHANAPTQPTQEYGSYPSAIYSSGLHSSGPYSSIPRATQYEGLLDPRLVGGYYPSVDRHQAERDQLYEQARVSTGRADNIPNYSHGTQEHGFDMPVLVERHSGMDSPDPTLPQSPERDDSYAYSRLLTAPEWTMPPTEPPIPVRSGPLAGNRLEDLPYDPHQLVSLPPLYDTAHNYNVGPPVNPPPVNPPPAEAGSDLSDPDFWIEDLDWRDSSSGAASCEFEYEFTAEGAQAENSNDNNNGDEQQAERNDGEDDDVEMYIEGGWHGINDDDDDDDGTATVVVTNGEIQLVGDEWAVPDPDTAVRQAPSPIGRSTTTSSHQVDDVEGGTWVDIVEGLAPADLSMSGGL